MGLSKANKLEEVSPIRSKTKKPIDEIESRRTSELIVALCGAVGSGTSTVAGQIKKHFESISYKVDVIKVSKIIESEMPVSVGISRYERVKLLQIAGNSLRGSNKGYDYLAQLVVKEIVEKRIEFVSEHLKIDKNLVDYGKDARIDRRHVTIIDSLKNPNEVELLQKVYGKMFYMFGVLCSDNKRKARLTMYGGMTDTEATDLMERDKKDKDKHGQQLLKTLQHSDFFIRNTRQDISRLKQPIERFINLLIGQNDITPTIDEFGMYMAESSARRSGCLSRQVGAAILTDEGDIVAIGRNDVPRAFGGLYGEENNDDARCFKRFDHACFNSISKKGIFHKLEKQIISILKDNNLDEKISQIFVNLKDDSEINDLLEYCRAVHAEMDAITTAARNGNYALKNTVLYSTTFPCHHCARHIVASGIKRVYYIEPYEKSLATKLHDDAIALDSQGDGNTAKKVVFLHFEGVAPKRYLSLFSCNNRKENDRLKEIQLNEQKPTDALLLDTFIEYESKIAIHVEESAKRAKEEANG